MFRKSGTPFSRHIILLRFWLFPVNWSPVHNMRRNLKSDVRCNKKLYDYELIRHIFFVPTYFFYDQRCKIGQRRKRRKRGILKIIQLEWWMRTNHYTIFSEWHSKNILRRIWKGAECVMSLQEWSVVISHQKMSQWGETQGMRFIREITGVWICNTG